MLSLNQTVAIFQKPLMVRMQLSWHQEQILLINHQEHMSLPKQQETLKQEITLIQDIVDYVNENS